MGRSKYYGTISSSRSEHGCREWGLDVLGGSNSLVTTLTPWVNSGGLELTIGSGWGAHAWFHYH